VHNIRTKKGLGLYPFSNDNCKNTGPPGRRELQFDSKTKGNPVRGCKPSKKESRGPLKGLGGTLVSAAENRGGKGKTRSRKGPRQDTVTTKAGPNRAQKLKVTPTS